MYVRMYICTYVYVYIYIYVWVFTFMRIYIYIYPTALIGESGERACGEGTYEEGAYEERTCGEGAWSAQTETAPTRSDGIKGRVAHETAASATNGPSGSIPRGRFHPRVHRSVHRKAGSIRVAPPADSLRLTFQEHHRSRIIDRFPVEPHRRQPTHRPPRLRVICRTATRSRCSPD